VLSNPPYSARNGVSPADVWPIYTIPIYSNLVEAATAAMGGTVDYPAEIRPQRMPGLPHATTKQTLNRGRFAGQSHDSFSLSLSLLFCFFSITHRTNGGEISLFFLLCDVHREHSTSTFFFILSTVGGYAASRYNRSLCSEERKYLGGFFALLVGCLWWIFFRFTKVTMLYRRNPTYIYIYIWRNEWNDMCYFFQFTYI